jgi:hypothetical protein
VWQTLSAGEDLPNREEIDLMARPWDDAHSAADCVKALLAQRERRRSGEGAPHPILSILAVLLFLLALSIVPWVWGQGKFEVWMLFLTPVLAGGAGAAIRPLVDRMRGTQGVAQAVLATVAVGLVAGGVAVDRESRSGHGNRKVCAAIDSVCARGRVCGGFDGGCGVREAAGAGGCEDFGD